MIVGTNLNAESVLKQNDKILSPSVEPVLNNNDEIKIPNVEEGDIVMFPAMTPHQGPELKTDERKTIISFNIDFNEVI